MTEKHLDISHFDAVDRSALPADGGPDYNRLIFSQSPYLLQHADNPVDWYPWGEEAFERARREEKPVFLSIGYSTCHWCHVMAHESFEDDEVAEVLRSGYIAIKVDREERPDIDNLYMTACQLMNRSGGWPLTLVLTPDKKPFFAATYLPKSSRGGMSGLIELLQQISTLWQDRRAEIIDNGEGLATALQRIDNRTTNPSALGDKPLRSALQDYRHSFDSRSGGFGPAPKFPTPHNLSLLFRLGERFAAPDAGRMACATIDAIRAGGVYDQFGFGLHRYAVDTDWQVPHFEKMLYDQALFIMAALDAWQVTGEERYARMVRETVSYLLRDLRAPEGAFYCGEDADSEGAEGTFYLWTPDQVNALLPADLAELACACYGITPGGNFEGHSIPHLTKPLTELADEHDLDEDVLLDRLEEAREILLRERSKRVRPHRDDKILTAWNGLTIAALARGGAFLEEPEWVSAAREAAAFISKELVDVDGRLLRSWRQGPSNIKGFADDYACFCCGLLELQQAGAQVADLERCLHWTQQTMLLFGNEQGDLWDIGGDAEQILGRGRSVMDGAVPAAGSVMAGVLLRLADLTGEENLRKSGESLLEHRLAQASSHPTAFAQLLMALDHALGPTQQLVICSTGDKGQGSGFRREIAGRFLPRLVVLNAIDGDKTVSGVSRLVEGRSAGATGVAAYLCHAHTCQPAVQNAAELGRLLDGLLQRAVRPV